MTVSSLYWHDYETFGVEPQRDRPAQFAGQRTDLDLNPVGDPLVLFCRPAGDYLPSPQSCLITGITPQRAQLEGVCEAQFIKTIYRELATPGTCALGYNTLRFDDEITRNCLYRNFFDPYEREWRHGNARWDIIDLVRATAALRPEGIEWPVDGAGRPSFKLESLTAANGLEHEDAHDALADVRATIALARLLKAKQPRLYDFVWRNKGKREAAALLRLGEFIPVVHVSEKFSPARYCLAVVVALARHPINGNGIITYDLSADPTPLLDLSEEEIRLRLYTPVHALPEGTSRIPLKTVHLNRCPVLFPLKVLRPEDQERLSIDLDQHLRHLKQITAAPRLEDKLMRVFGTPPPEMPDATDPDLMIYRGGFFSERDRSRMAEIRAMAPGDLGRRHFDFDDPRLPEMLFRYRARNWPETLTPDEACRWENYRRTRLTEVGRGGTSWLEEFNAQLDALAAEGALDRAGSEIVAALRAWAKDLTG